MNEFELIARLARVVERPLPKGWVGIGDDCAAVPDPAGEGVTLYTCDAAVEGRHFLQGKTPWEDVGWRLAAASVSDIAACGGAPQAALVALNWPRQYPAEDAEALYRGLARAARDFGFQVIGGNVSSADQVVVDLFMTGRAPRLVPRGGAGPGHGLWLSGPVGDSAAGLAVLKGEPGGGPEDRAVLLHRHLRPHPRLDLAPLLAAHASAAMDISDGLAPELGHLARASGVELRVEGAAVPLSEELRRGWNFRGPLPQDPAFRLALYGGEDYQILFTLPVLEGKEGRKRDDLFLQAGAVEIGRVLPGERGEGRVWLDGMELPEGGGWDHLKGG
ncbi:MAG: thiamine-phosphate kinase [Deltaproteobacteria bacterium]|nr:thiamine-phosphate kinase [Deltaproteobacteria bacterium]